MEDDSDMDRVTDAMSDFAMSDVDGMVAPDIIVQVPDHLVGLVNLVFLHSACWWLFLPQADLILQFVDHIDEFFVRHDIHNDPEIEEPDRLIEAMAQIVQIYKANPPFLPDNRADEEPGVGGEDRIVINLGDDDDEAVCHQAGGVQRRARRGRNGNSDNGDSADENMGVGALDGGDG